MTRRQYLAATGAAALAAGVGARPAFALEDHPPGLPDQHLGHADLLSDASPASLEKRGLKIEEFAVPSGNLTMQQMVARQVDIGTYAGQSFTIGHDKGGLVAIAQIEIVGKTAQIVVRKDLNITKVEQLKGTQGRQPDRLVDRQHLRRHHRDQNAGLKKGDFQEVRMDVNDMVAALAAKTVDAMVNVEPYNAIAVAEGIGTSIMDFSSVDRMPVFMAATPDFVDKNPDTVVAYLKAWQDVAKRLQGEPEQGRGRDLFVLHLEGLQHVEATPSPRRWRASRSIRASPPTCRPDLQKRRRSAAAGRRRFPPSRTGRRRCVPSSGRRPAPSRAPCPGRGAARSSCGAVRR